MYDLLQKADIHVYTYIYIYIEGDTTHISLYMYTHMASIWVYFCICIGSRDTHIYIYIHIYTHMCAYTRQFSSGSLLYYMHSPKVVMNTCTVPHMKPKATTQPLFPFDFKLPFASPFLGIIL